MELLPDKTFLEYFYAHEKNQPDKIFLKQPFGNTYKDFSWKEVGLQARTIASYLESLNLPPKTNIGLISKNCAEWLIADFGILMAGHVSVPFYGTLNAEQLNQVMTHSGCRVLFIGKMDDTKSIEPGIPEGVKCISFPTYNPQAKHVQWEWIMNSFKPKQDNFIPDLNDLFSIIYTSGTTGNPKGVMITYKALTMALYYTRHYTKLDYPESRFISYLPLCHVAERMVIESGATIAGATVYFAETVESFARNLAVANPTHFLAVPRIWTKFQLGILSKISQSKLDILLKIPIVNNLIKTKIRKGLGLNDAIIILASAAPMPVLLIEWFKKLGIIIQEAYGMTENLGVATMMPREKIKNGTIGKPYPGMEIKLMPETNEICTRSAWNMNGYYREPEMTAATIDTEGWIHTGDVGEIDNEGYLKITGRVKEMYKTAKGEYVAPAPIEAGFSANCMIEQICVAGNNLPQPIALVILSDIGKAESAEKVNESLQETLHAVNATLKPYEKVRRIVILNEPWTIDNNKLTPTMKIKRGNIEKEFESYLETWYNRKEYVVWQ
ncbi:AMP-binding protein [Emticicia sp. TH156]|uniref:AMP-binding protein n=1 Tax=Emticicia sp. TH156 TaxID=2067454 RepID=UPI000C77EBB6|nr:AMP-binding protein [Emticicia sp. TH156]PLK45417.1 AMP-dependent synthetase [Emticicia sp. TH156]